MMMGERFTCLIDVSRAYSGERFMVIIESRKILSQKNEHTQVKNRLTNGALTDTDTWRSLTGGLTLMFY